jgi:dethiobiotin synthetase
MHNRVIAMAKRISITPTNQVEDVLNRISIAKVIPKATIINDLLNEAYPALLILANAYESIIDKKDINQALSNLLLNASAKIVEGAGMMLKPEKKEIDDNLPLPL